MAITLTDSATQRIAEQLDKNHAAALRFAVAQSGCSGYSYVMDLTDKIDEDDTVYDYDGVKLVVDSKSLAILDGTQIDYVAEGLNQTFKFSNPKATDECGCGESFAVRG